MESFKINQRKRWIFQETLFKHRSYAIDSCSQQKPKDKEKIKNQKFSTNI